MIYKTNISKMKLYLFGLKIGLCSILHGNFKIALKRIILPINYWRVTIFKVVAKYILNMNIHKNFGIRILDIGSPKLLSLFIAQNINGQVYATDLQDETIFTEWREYFQNTANKDNVIFEYANAKDLKYPDNYFAAIYSLSVIHMITPGKDGDIKALMEIQKKIKHGGILIIEVPYRERYTEYHENRNNFEEKYNGNPLFKERQYDDEALESRIITNINGSLIEKVILYEKFPFDSFWNKLPKYITTALAFIEPWVDMVNISIAKNEKQIKTGKSVILIFIIKE